MIGTEITIDTSAGTVRLDVGSRTPQGGLRLIDSKKGPKAGLTKNQKVGYPALEKEGGMPRGPRAQGAGLTDEPLPPTKVIIDRHDE